MTVQSFRDNRIVSQFSLLVFPAVLVIVGLAAWTIHQHNVTRLEDKLVKRAQSISLQILADRDYYTRVLVPRVLELGGHISAEYSQTHGHFPLPVVFIQEASDRIVAQGGLFQSRLISPWPINPQRGVSDSFQREAFHVLQGNPTGSFYRLDQVDGRTVFRYLTADRATSQSCVDCHNTHPLSIKRDFKLNDVMGGLEIIFPADQYLQEDRDDALMMAAGGMGLFLILLGLITTGVHQIITRPLARLSSYMDRRVNTVTGGLAIPNAAHDSQNELRRFEAFFERMQACIASHQSKVQAHESALAVCNARLHEHVEQQTQACLTCEQQMKTILDCANDAIMYITTEGRIQWCNFKATKLTGWPEAELIGASIEAFLTPQSFARAQDRLAAVKRGETVPDRVHFEIIKRTGETTRGEANIASMREAGKVVGRVLVLREHTES